MQSFENNPKSPTKRLGVDLNIDTGYNKGKRRDVSPPRTPKMESYRAVSRANIVAANRALKVRTGQRETFLDDITPIDPSSRQNDVERSRPDQRDSHDLSLSPQQVTRDSLVDHMLLSLDQFSFGQDGDGFGRQPTVEEEKLYSSFVEEEPYPPTSNFASRNARNGRGAGHGYSYSSDYDIADDSSRYSGGQNSRGRRSNSSSNFQSSLGRIDSKRDNSTFAPRGQPQQPAQLALHSRSGKGSKGSSTNSFDLGYAQVTSNHRWTHGLAGRSSSFDYGSSRLDMNSPPPPPMARQADNAFNPYDYDAAPTPTVPVGPRRIHPASPITIPTKPEPLPIETPPPKLERKRSTRSSKSGYKGKLGAQGSRYDYGLSDRNRELPPMPAFMKETAPAPTVGFGKPKDVSTTTSALPQPPKEKPGFFRRVFGGSRNNPVNSPEPPRSHGSATSAETTDRPSSTRQHVGSQMKSQPPPREPPPAPKEPTHVLTKKPSSFFRRRKKSVTEFDAPVPVPTVPLKLKNDREPDKIDREPEVEKPLPSPVSSLRQVMNPYLRTPLRSPIDLFSQSTLDQKSDDSYEFERIGRGFSPDYEPDPSATIRAVETADDELPMDHIGAQLDSEHPMPYSPDFCFGGERSKDATDVTFLQDSSDNERDASDIAPVSKPEPNRGKTVATNSRVPSPAVVRDMALVAEYERTHSKRSPTPAKAEVAKTSPVIASLKSGMESRSSLRQTVLGAKGEDWVMLTPNKSPNQVAKEHRVWLEPSSSEEDLPAPGLALPGTDGGASGVSSSTDTVYKSATSLPILQIEGEEASRPTADHLMSADEAIRFLEEPVLIEEGLTPADGDCERAQKVFDGNEDFIQREKAAAWMGEEGAARTKTLIAYMELYDFTNLNILASLRNMCGRLVLKAESQQVDRILVAFARRWCECNPNHGFKAIGESKFVMI